MQRNLTHEREEREKKEREVAELKSEIEELGRAQNSMEARLEEERKTAMEVGPPPIILYQRVKKVNTSIVWELMLLYPVLVNSFSS